MSAAPALVLGCSRLGSVLTPLGRRDCTALIAEALALGLRHFDTASIYGQGDSERYLGEALRGRRDRIVLASKAGQMLSGRQALLKPLKPAVRWLAARRAGVHRQVGAQRAVGLPRCFEPDHIERSLLASLKRLRTDHLDIFYLHSPPPEALDDEVLMGRLLRLQSAGLFRALGVSCDDAALVRRAAREPLVQVLQFDLREPGLDLPALLAGLAAEGRQAMLRGFSAGGGEGLAGRFAAALALPALAGLIVGTTRAAHLRENAAAFDQARRGLSHPGTLGLAA